jgi:hypothetical protein
VFGLKVLGFSALVFSWVSMAHGACTDLSKANSFTLKRNDPFFEVTNTIMNDGSVKEERVMQRDGSTQRVTTIYWNGLIPVDRKSSSSRIQLKMNDKVKNLNLEAVSKSYKVPVSILVNGNEVDTGSFIVKTVRRTSLDIGGCKYPAMIVRTTIEPNNGAPINEEALLSMEAGMLLGNVAMTSSWQAKHGVFFDQIKAN